jgi:hypothetical protein
MAIIVARVVLEREDMLLDEGARPCTHIFDFRDEGKIDHGVFTVLK